MKMKELLLSIGGRNLINNILSFIGSLVIKNDQEANEFETRDTRLYYEKYRDAYLEADTLSSYNISYEDLIAAGFTTVESSRYFQDPSLLLEVSDTYNPKINLLKSKRKDLLDNYIDANPYYRVLMGLPKDNTEFVYVTNDDVGEEQIPVHLVTFEDYPLTYDRIFTRKNILKIIEDYPQFIYLNFINEPLNIYDAREAGNLSILYYKKDQLSNSELNYFFQSYEEIRDWLINVKYVAGFETRYDLYSNVLLIVLLYGTLTRFFYSYIDRYVIKDYTDSDIYSIIESNGFSRLKDVSLTTLRKVVKNLDKLQAHQGIESVLQELLSITTEGNAKVRRYNLVKKYLVDELGQTWLDPSKPYEESVSVDFKNVNAETSASLDSQISAQQVLSYDELAGTDPLWGGVGEIEDGDSRYKIKEELRKSLLTKSFNELRTKYIVVSNVIYSNDPYLKSLDMFSLSIQLDGLDSFIFNDEIDYNGVKVTPFDLYSTMCWAKSIINDIPEPDTIKGGSYILSSVVRLEQRSKAILEQIVGNSEIETIDGSHQKIFNILSNYNLQDYLVSFDLPADPTLTSIDNAYPDVKITLDKVLQKLESAPSENQLRAWWFIYSFNTFNHSFVEGFKGATTFSEYLIDNCPDFYTLIYKDFTENIDKLNLENMVISMMTVFRTYLSDSTQGILQVSIENEQANADMMKDLQLLMDEFTSIYCNLYKVETQSDLTDYPFNCLKFRHEMRMQHEEENQEKVLFEHDFCFQETVEHKDTLLYTINIKEFTSYAPHVDTLKLDDTGIVAIQHVDEISEKFLMNEEFVSETETFVVSTPPTIAFDHKFEILDG